MSLYTCSQRVVSAKIPRPSPQSDIDLLLVDSLPDYGLLKYHLAEKPSKSSDKLSSQSASPEAFAYLQTSSCIQITASRGKSWSRMPSLTMSSKWQTLVFYTHVKISESKAPLTGNLQLIAEVIQRKHDFERMQRTIMANLRSARLLPGIQPEKSGAWRPSCLPSHHSQLGFSTRKCCILASRSTSHIREPQGKPASLSHTKPN